MIGEVLVLFGLSMLGVAWRYRGGVKPKPRKPSRFNPDTNSWDAWLLYCILSPVAGLGIPVLIWFIRDGRVRWII